MSGEIAALVDVLRPAGSKRHQGITLLWAIGRARRGLPRLVRWTDAQPELRELIAAYGLDDRPTPEYPFVALAHTPWWELAGVDEPVPRAHGSGVLRWLNDHDPAGGLREPVYDRLSRDADERAATVQALMARFFPTEPSSLVVDATQFGDDDLDVLVSAPEEPTAFEGRLRLLRHYAYERDPKLRKKKIDRVLAASGCLECEVCGFDFERTYGERGKHFAEVHHKVPLHVSAETTNGLDDLAVLCANCHRMIHRGPEWLTPAELRALLRR